MPMDPETLEHAPGVQHENLEGWIPALTSDQDLRTALEKAFDYRGDITVTLKDGTKVEGYIFDRRTGPTLSDCSIRMFPRDGRQKVTVRYSEVAHLAFTGKDTAAGKSFETWLKKYLERKAAGEKDISLEPEKLD